MVDVVLIPAGETATAFEFVIAFDRDYPMATAQSWPNRAASDCRG